MNFNQWFTEWSEKELGRYIAIYNGMTKDWAFGAKAAWDYRQGEIATMQSWVESKNHELKIMQSKLNIAIEALEYIAFHISSSPHDKDGGPDRTYISDDRNNRILKAKEALEKIK